MIDKEIRTHYQILHEVISGITFGYKSLAGTGMEALLVGFANFCDTFFWFGIKLNFQPVNGSFQHEWLRPFFINQSNESQDTGPASM